ncbi:MAG: hypothetical protein CMI53_03545 [Parcubacteria group bacterium]|jgi:uncharacterized membrane protein|nr:hypothetical protein [Parcubacteria group bacterium]|tara:strand:- start:246 stop:551 length:306 start_codon:yes stop_codon:yes gene_type:complete
MRKFKTSLPEGNNQGGFHLGVMIILLIVCSAIALILLLVTRLFIPYESFSPIGELFFAIAIAVASIGVLYIIFKAHDFIIKIRFSRNFYKEKKKQREEGGK